jgi:signal transduction histidine kinase
MSGIPNSLSAARSARAVPPLVLVVSGSREVADAVASRFRVIHQPRGSGALEALREHRPDVVIAEFPLDDRREFCILLQRHFSHVPLIAIPAGGDAAFADISEEADEVLFLPMPGAELEFRVSRVIGKVRARAGLRQTNARLREELADLQEAGANLVQAEKLSQLGEMIAGIVHEINNPLNYSQSGLHVLRSMVGSLDDAQREFFREVLDDVSEGIERVNRIVGDLRKFSSRSRNGDSEVDLAEVVRISTRLLGHKLGSIDVDIDVPDRLFVHGNENKYCQVIVNLIKNGVEATEDAGRSLADSKIRVRTERDEGRVILRIRDNGCGIPRERLREVFTPFYSTKEAGKGTGLGLSICRRIMEESGGSIAVESVEGSHTEIIVAFPEAAHARTPAKNPCAHV